MTTNKPVVHTKVLILTRSSGSRSLSGYCCLWESLCGCLCRYITAGDTSWVGGPLAIPPTHCCHLSLWDKPWVTLEHHHWTFCCVGVRLHRRYIDGKGWSSTVNCRIEVTGKMVNYHIAGNFRGRKLSQISKVFVKVFSMKIVFFTNSWKVFSLESFPLYGIS